MYYEDIFKALQERRVKYLVVGGVAMGLHGIPRMTADLDIMLDLTPANIKKFIAATGKIGYVPRPPLTLGDFLDQRKRKSWAEEKNMVMFTLINPKIPYQELDVFVENPMDFKELYAGKKIAQFGNIEIPVASMDGLIALKEKTGRRQDKADISILKRLIKNGSKEE